MPEFNPVELTEGEKNSISDFLIPYLANEKISNQSVKTHLFTSPEKSKKISFGRNIEIYGTHFLVGEYPQGVSSTLFDGDSHMVLPGKDGSCMEYTKLFGERKYSKKVECEPVDSGILAMVNNTVKKDHPETYFGSDVQIYRIGEKPLKGMLVKEDRKGKEEYKFEL